jgi:hypothetical protein
MCVPQNPGFLARCEPTPSCVCRSDTSDGRQKYPSLNPHQIVSANHSFDCSLADSMTTICSQMGGNAGDLQPGRTGSIICLSGRWQAFAMQPEIKKIGWRRIGVAVSIVWSANARPMINSAIPIIPSRHRADIRVARQGDGFRKCSPHPTR